MIPKCKAHKGYCEECKSYDTSHIGASVGYCNTHGCPMASRSWCPEIQLKNQVSKDTKEDKWYHKEQINSLYERHYDSKVTEIEEIDLAKTCSTCSLGKDVRVFGYNVHMVCCTKKSKYVDMGDISPCWEDLEL